MTMLAILLLFFISYMTAYTNSMRDPYFCAEDEGVQNRTRDRCCINYQKVNGRCRPCPNGRIGINCTETCPQGHYGLGCRSTCRCLGNERCTPEIGCAETDEGFSKELSNNRVYVLIGVGCINILLLVSMWIHTCNRKKKQSADRNDTECHENEKDVMEFGYENTPQVTQNVKRKRKQSGDRKETECHENEKGVKETVYENTPQMTQKVKRKMKQSADRKDAECHENEKDVIEFDYENTPQMTQKVKRKRKQSGDRKDTECRENETYVMEIGYVNTPQMTQKV